MTADRKAGNKLYSPKHINYLFETATGTSVPFFVSLLQKKLPHY